ncbi:MAG: alpha/beta hydrolase [Bacteroidetes bacterium]|nr:alpha/beta hydrolase [Bacteroidota bacterium]
MKRIVIILSPFFILILLLQCKTTEKQETSSKSRMIYKMLKSADTKDKTFVKLLNNPERGTNEISASKINKKLQVEERIVNGFKVLTFQSPSATNKHIVFFHGGAYVAEAMKGHRILIEKLALIYHFKVSFIDYPLAPENDATLCLQMIQQAYIELIAANLNDEFYLLGDSAGGGLALSLLQLLRDNNRTIRPKKTVLLSPWLDISMSNPEILNFVDKDVLLSLSGLNECAKLYAREMDLKNPKVSPIYGNLENLSEIKVFVSTHELFYPDCSLLKSKIDSVQGSTIDLSFKKEMIHDWLVLPIPESDETIQEVADFFMSE